MSTLKPKDGNMQHTDKQNVETTEKLYKIKISPTEATVLSVLRFLIESILKIHNFRNISEAVADLIPECCRIQKA